MKRLILMRHAKSDWAHGLADEDRPLNARGRRAAPVMAGWLATQGPGQDWLPDEVLCSTAARTRETLSLLNVDAPARFVPELYLASPVDLRKALRGAKGQRVLMLGHNPGLAQWAEALIKAPPDHPKFAQYPTCATLVVDFAIQDWTDLQDGQGDVAGFAVPRDLMD